jgi:two-component system C4-dicarboxylate transport sensor histidine kinase DctB
MLVKPRIKKSNTSLSHSISESAIAYGNSIQISQVILNLLTNAIDAINDSTSSYDKQLITVSYQDHEEFTSILVEDSGPGIIDSDKSQIFEPFFTSKKTGAGLGLGLPIVKDIIKMHHGKLALTQSTLGGACFTIELPKKSEVIHDAI